MCALTHKKYCSFEQIKRDPNQEKVMSSVSSFILYFWYTHEVSLMLSSKGINALLLNIVNFSWTVRLLNED